MPKGVHPNDEDKRGEEALEIAKQCEPILKGRAPEVQGAALADLTSLWLAGHHPDLREAVLEQWIDTVRDLIVANAKLRGLWT